MISDVECQAIEARIAAYDAARKAFDPKRYARGGEYSPEDVRAILTAANLDRDATNEERAAVEVYHWHKDPPDRYFLYVDETTRKATTWTGEVLGDVTFGREYKLGAFGGRSTRVPVRIVGTNGRSYFGTYYKSSGNYARVRRCRAVNSAAARRVPLDYPVQPVVRTGARGECTCGTCRLTWDDARVTSMTPAPSGRCPFEVFHRP